MSELNKEESLDRGRSSLGQVLTTAAAVIAVIVCVVLLVTIAMSSGSRSQNGRTDVANVTIMDKYDMFMTNEISNALDGILSIKKVYWLSDTDEVAPKPDQENYGEVTSPEELGWLLEEAAELIDGQEMLFNTQTPIWNRDKIYYYYDETILVITWKQIINNCVHTISEVKIAHPSQFRRGLAGGEFGSD